MPRGLAGAARRGDSGLESARPADPVTGTSSHSGAGSMPLTTLVARAYSTARHRIRSWRNASQPGTRSLLPKRRAEQDPMTSSRRASSSKPPRRFHNQTRGEGAKSFVTSPIRLRPLRQDGSCLLRACLFLRPRPATARPDPETDLRCTCVSARAGRAARGRRRHDPLPGPLASHQPP
jgi:hypothetical protein